MKLTLSHYNNSALMKRIFFIAMPIALQNVMVNFLNMLDTLMLSRVGESEVAAVGLANQPFFVFSLLLFGVSSGACVLTSQYYGIDDTRAIKRIISFSLAFAAIIGFSVSCVMFFFPTQVMSFYTDIPILIEIGAKYLKIAALSYFPMALSTTYLGIVVSVGEPSLPLKINVLALFFNTSLNLILIFGLFGVPALGAQGAAIATVISRLLELSLVLLFIFKLDDKICMTLKDFFTFDKVLTKDFFYHCTPVICNEFFWSFGVSFYSVILGHMNPYVITAYNIVLIVERMLGAFQLGIGRSAGVIVGMELGQKNTKNAYDYSKVFFVFAALSGVFVMFLYAISPTIISAFMVLTPQTFEALRMMLLVELILAIARSVHCVAIIGVFRGGGDTIFAALLDTLPIYCITIPLGLLASYLGLPIFFIYLFMRSDEVVKFAVSMWRFTSKKWMRNVTREDFAD